MARIVDFNVNQSKHRPVNSNSCNVVRVSLSAHWACPRSTFCWHIKPTMSISDRIISDLPPYENGVYVLNHMYLQSL